ncbi:MAG: hypothetical protein IPQ03_04810 [Bacteroidetes bacterium]|nr:hypothetical protein [Bacteroidota bacterium]
MKSKFNSHWFLVLIAGIVGAHTYWSFSYFIYQYIPAASHYEHALTIWWVQIITLAIVAIIWYCLITLNKNLLSILKLYLIILFLMFVLPSYWTAYTCYKDNLIEMGNSWVSRSLVYSIIIISLFILSHRQIVQVKYMVEESKDTIIE